MQLLKARVVDGLEMACRATRLVEWVPGWRRIYPQCMFARWSSALDYRWGTGRWQIHDADGDEAWEEWYDAAALADPSFKGHWHHW